MNNHDSQYNFRFLRTILYNFYIFLQNQIYLLFFKIKIFYKSINETKNSIVNKVNNKLTSVNNSIRKSVQRDLVLNILRILLLLYTAFVIPVLKDKQLKLVENQLLRLF